MAAVGKPADCFIARLLANTTPAEETLDDYTIGLDIDLVGRIAVGLSVNTSLQTLTLKCAQIQNMGCAAIGGALRVNIALQHLVLNANGIRDEGASRIAQALCDNSTLLRLELNSNDIRAQGCTELAGMLRANSALRVLKLNRTVLCAEGFNAISDSLRANNTLRALELNGSCGHWDERSEPRSMSFEVLQESLCLNHSLLVLKLDKRRCSVTEACQLSNILRVNTTLRSLSLSTCCIGDEGLALLAKSLGENCPLKILNLNQNRFGSKGCTAIAESLRTNTTLQLLSLNSNFIRDEGCTALSAVLSTNKSLDTLRMQWNDITSAGFAVLCDALLENSVMEILDCSVNNIDPRGFLKLAQVLVANNTFSKVCLPPWKASFIPHEVSLAIGSALRDSSRLSVFLLQSDGGFPSDIINPACKALGLPAEAQQWDDLEIASHFHRAHVMRCALAFGTGNHKRLGEKSWVQGLNVNVVDLIMRIFLGMLPR